MTLFEQVRPLTGNPARHAWGAALAIGLVATSHLAAGPASAAPGGRSALALSDAQRATALADVEKLIAANYVFKELRAPIVARLQASMAAHRYDVVDPQLFATRVTEDLQAISHDGHLYLDSDPGEYAAALAPAKSDSGLEAYRRALAVREHYGLTETAILPGNIRYLKITGFKWVAGGATEKVYDEAARFLADGDATIVDLRGNGGGVSNAADYFMKVIVRSGVAKAAVVDPQSHKPFYILVDGFVGSAAEAVTYGAQVEKRATIVGTTTYGAANNNKRFPVAPGFILSVSYNRPINPISRTNWEGVGVVPDLKIDSSLASEAAQIDALDRLAKRPGESADRLADYRWRRTYLEGRLHPVTVDAETMRAAAGTYGPIELRYSEAGLRFYRPDRPHWPQGLLLQPLSDSGVYALEGDDIRIRFTADGLELVRPGDGAPEPFKREKVPG